MDLKSAKKFRPAPGFDLRTVQSVATRYTDWAIAAHGENGMSKHNKQKRLKDTEGDE